MTNENDNYTRKTLADIDEPQLRHTIAQIGFTYRPGAKWQDTVDAIERALVYGALVCELVVWHDIPNKAYVYSLDPAPARGKLIVLLRKYGGADGWRVVPDRDNVADWLLGRLGRG